ncbi:MAG: hypothetical protein D6812_11870 [Deltaproteobacteria bacterium]|nr:MAG: hypothetical protein D6812_11870 [Deltaproteobacteria bacterium]
MKVAIIGTAGRREDGARLDARAWSKMQEDVKQRIEELGHDVELVSGGSAWADHLAVWLYLQGVVHKIELALPADIRKGRFVEGIGRADPGRTLNYYHELFSGKIYRGWEHRERVAGETLTRGAIASVAEIEEALGGEGCVATYWDGFRERNKWVAAISDVVLAYTFGKGDTPRDGETHDTWKRCNSGVRKIHVSLEDLL